jgi:multiple sugar transport system permease protein
LASLPTFHSVARGRLAPRLLAAPLVGALLVFAAFPLLYLVAASLSKSSLGKPFQSFVGLANYAEALRDTVFLGALGRSVLLALPVALMQLVLGTAIALLLLNLTRRRGFLARTLILLPLMTPPVMVGIAWKLLLAPSGGLVNSLLLRLGLFSEPVSFLGQSPLALLMIAVTEIWQWTPFVILLVYAALLGLPREVLEAARVDGATPLQALRRVVLPLLWPALAAVLLIRLIMAFKSFDLIYLLTFGGPGYDTTTGTFLIYRVAFQQFDVGAAAAQTLLFGLLVGLVTLPFVWLRDRALRMYR